MKEKTKKWNSLLPRLITGIFGGAAVIFLLVIHQYTAFFMLLLIGVGCLWEYYNIAKKSKLNPNLFSTLLGALLLLLNLFFQFDIEWVLLFILFLTACMELIKENQNIVATISSTVLGLIYTLVPVILMAKTSVYEDTYDWRIVIALFIMIWAFDSGAYFAGKFFGKHKMIPNVSPGKTWEGTLGGCLLCFVSVFLFSNAFSFFTFFECIVYAVLVSICGTFGDLLVSQMKRNIDLKDTGSILPGHGGFLDRFDGFLMAASFYSITMLLLENLGHI